tara:strand:+ start:263 stop:739 length:477 start_codon:yes stop_codon:yes gene_type:complete
MTKSTPSFISSKGTKTATSQTRTSATGSDGKANAVIFCTSGKTTLSSFAVGDELVLCELPAYAILSSIRIHHAALGGSTTMQVGDVSDDDRYITATSTSSTGVLAYGDAYNSEFNFDIETVQSDGNQQIIMKGAGATANGVVAWQVLYHGGMPSVRQL